MNPVDQKLSQTAAELMNKAGIPLVLLVTKFSDDFTSDGGKFVTYVGSEDEMAIGASSAIQAADRLEEFRVLVGVNGSKPALDAVKAGTLTATVFQDAVGQGTQAVVAARKNLAGEIVEPQLIIPFKLITRENVSSF
jgi:inositol transport system substrate-binding protein